MNSFFKHSFLVVNSVVYLLVDIIEDSSSLLFSRIPGIAVLLVNKLSKDALCFLFSSEILVLYSVRERTWTLDNSLVERNWFVLPWRHYHSMLLQP